jgi:hypothetical protein
MQWRGELICADCVETFRESFQPDAGTALKLSVNHFNAMRVLR